MRRRGPYSSPSFAPCGYAGAPAPSGEAVRSHGILGRISDPYRPKTAPPPSVGNSGRLDSLLRAGNLYLSLQDAIALALENNLDIAIQRYAPALAREVLMRTQSGNALRGVGQNISPGPQSVSLAGVTSGTVGLPDTGSGVSSGAASERETRFLTCMRYITIYGAAPS